MITYVLTGIGAGLATVIIGIRLYNIFFSWGDYKQMIKNFGENNIKDLTIIITGCNSGIGKETARELYKHGARIIMANRSLTQTDKIMNEFQKQFPSSGGQLIYKNLDLTSMNSVKNFSNDIIASESRLDVLISNAAVFGAPYQITEDGFEINMQVNHLAPALLVQLLLPKLGQTNNKSGENGRIIAVTSTLIKSGIVKLEYLSKISNDQLENLPKRSQQIYASTKLANFHYMHYLSGKTDLIKNVEICLASPGFCFTRLHRYTSRSKLLFMSLFAPLFLMIMKSSKQGAQTIIGCSMIRNVRPDVLYHNCKENDQFFKNVAINDRKQSELIYNNTMETIQEYLKN